MQLLQKMLLLKSLFFPRKYDDILHKYNNVFLFIIKSKPSGKKETAAHISNKAK